DVHLGDQVAIFGQGVIGLLATRLAVLSGARVAAADALTARLELSTAYGAADTFDVTGGSAAEALGPFDTAIELSGSHRGLHEAIRSVRRGGRVVAAGFYQGEGAGLRLGEEFHHNQVQLVSSQIGGVASGLAHRWDVERLQRTFMELVWRGQVDVGPLVSHVVPAGDAAKAFELIDRDPAQVLQLVFDFTQEGGS
ncbi:MAG: zinc-binding alcohol dehydrogenase, partial [Nonomuraea sp.]|nr:zinc-binding alcohol dehydrogenase [Nonomuraea sp.]